MTILPRSVIAALAAPLAACAAAPIPAPVAVRPHVPPALLTCAGEPPPPEAPTLRTYAYWVLDVRAAGAECRGKLREVRGLVAAGR